MALRDFELDIDYSMSSSIVSRIDLIVLYVVDLQAGFTACFLYAYDTAPGTVLAHPDDLLPRPF